MRAEARETTELNLVSCGGHPKTSCSGTAQFLGPLLSVPVRAKKMRIFLSAFFRRMSRFFLEPLKETDLCCIRVQQINEGETRDGQQETSTPEFPR
jgi:hypothetical protein